MKWIKKFYLELLLGGMFFVLLIFPKFLALYIGVLILTVVYAYVKKDIKFHFSWGSIGFILLYLAYLIGVFWTQNPKQAEFYVVNKIAFILFPFLFAFKKKTKFQINIVYTGLVLATIIAFLGGVIGGIPCYLEHSSFPYCFLSSHLSPIIHPTYMTVFAQFSMLALFKMVREKAINRALGNIGIAFMVSYSVLLMSLSGLLFLLILIVAFVIWKALQKFSRKVVFIAVPLLLTLMILSAPRVPYLKNDIANSTIAMKKFMASPANFIRELPENPGGSDVRLVMWTVAVEEIEDNRMGVGTGNVDIYLGDNLRRRGLNAIADKEYNPHNQFLQTTLEIGFIGGIILILIFVLGFYEAKRTKNWILFFLFACLFLNSLFESMLQHQSAIIFFPLLYLLLMIEFNSPKSEST
jgi:O-antigen ligase